MKTLSPKRNHKWVKLKSYKARRGEPRAGIKSLSFGLGDFLALKGLKVHLY